MDLTKIDNVQLDDVHTWDYPKFCDAYISYAELEGVEMTEEQLDELNEDTDFLHEQINKHHARY